MLKKEAKEITGGLSAPSKMPGPSFNLPAVACITGAKLVDVLGSTCSGCYALKGRYRFPNVRSVQAYTGDQALAAHTRSPLPEADGSGRSSQKFKNCIVRSYE